MTPYVGRRATMPANSRQTLWARTQDHKRPGGCHLAIKYTTIPLEETEYVQQAAKKLGISRTRLVQVLIEKVVSDELILDLLGDENQAKPPQSRYRRFRKEGRD
jgi:hypothetical protein